MKRRYYFALAFPLAVLGGVAAADLGAAQDFNLPGTSAPDVPDTDVPDVPAPTCVSCGAGYHCNAAGDGCEPDETPDEPKPDPAPEPKEDPIDVPA